jgi:hypothetical protein
MNIKILLYSIMSKKPSSRFAAKGTKKVQALRTESLAESDDILIKQPWTLTRG